MNLPELFANKVVFQTGTVYLKLMDGFIVANLKMVFTKRAEW